MGIYNPLTDRSLITGWPGGATKSPGSEKNEIIGDNLLQYGCRATRPQMSRLVIDFVTSLALLYHVSRMLTVSKAGASLIDQIRLICLSGGGGGYFFQHWFHLWCCLIKKIRSFVKLYKLMTAKPSIY